MAADVMNSLHLLKNHDIPHPAIPHPPSPLKGTGENMCDGENYSPCVALNWLGVEESSKGSCFRATRCKPSALAMNAPIGISEYQLNNLLKDEFKGKLPTIEEIERELRD